MFSNLDTVWAFPFMPRQLRRDNVIPNNNNNNNHRSSCSSTSNSKLNYHRYHRWWSVQPAVAVSISRRSNKLFGEVTS